MYTCQCKECQMRQNSGVLLKEMGAFLQSLLIEVSQKYIYMYFF